MNNFRAEMIDCQSSPRDHSTPITRGLTLDRKKVSIFPRSQRRDEGSAEKYVFRDRVPIY